ncbi:MAG: NAD(P)/FAD-dependent oxidoreductase [Chloroflexota bacterium]
MADCDILIIGAGHNALVCAGYLAKSGYKVMLLERRHKVGGAVVTEEHVPGFKFDLGGSAHILIHHTPIVQDLELEKYGLHYLDIDPLFFAPFPDGTSITMYKDIDRTVESIAAVDPEDAENYRKFIETWYTVAEASVEAFNHAPTPFNLVKHLGIETKMGDKRWERLSDMLRGYGQMLRNHFTGEKVPAMIAWMAAQSGPPPTEPLSAPFAIWHPMYHTSGMKRPRGGSGELTQSLRRMIEDHGGVICTDMPVRRILVENGKAVGAQTASGEHFTASKAVVSGAHIYTTMGMLGDDMPQDARTLISKSRIGNGFGMIVRYALDELPNYTVAPTQPGEIGEHHRALQFICPSMQYLDTAYGDFLSGRPSTNPALISMTFSAVDPTLAPEGKHTMFLWGQYYPYELASGDSWDDIGERVAERMLDTLAEYAPNVKDAVIGKLIETPLYLERELGLLRGNVMHLEMSVDQMFVMRPALTMSNYRAPVKGLYLTGASTHPGGGIMGAAGRNAATVLLHDLEPKWWQFGGNNA